MSSIDNGLALFSAVLSLHIRVASREDAGNKESICDVRKNADSQVRHGNHIRAGSTCSTATSTENLNKVGIIICNHDSTAESTSNEENTKSPVHCIEGLLEVLAGR